MLGEALYAMQRRRNVKAGTSILLGGRPYQRTMPSKAVGVDRYEFHLSAADLVVILGELQRRTGSEVFLGGCERNDGYIEFRRPIPSTWAGCEYYHLRFWPYVRDSDFVVAEWTLAFLNLASEHERGRPWHPGPSASAELAREAENACRSAWVARAAPGTGEAAEELARMLVLRLQTGYRKYHWDADSWRTFVRLAFARREAVWADAHVWPDALALYHVLTRRGLDGGCAASVMAELVVAPRVRAFRGRPQKRRGCGHWVVAVR